MQICITNVNYFKRLMDFQLCDILKKKVSIVVIVKRHHGQSNLYKKFIEAYSFRGRGHDPYCKEHGRRQMDMSLEHQLSADILRQQPCGKEETKQKQCEFSVTQNSQCHSSAINATPLSSSQKVTNWGPSLKLFDPLGTILLQTTTFYFLVSRGFRQPHNLKFIY